VIPPTVDQCVIPSVVDLCATQACVVVLNVVGRCVIQPCVVAPSVVAQCVIRGCVAVLNVADLVVTFSQSPQLPLSPRMPREVRSGPSKPATTVVHQGPWEDAAVRVKVRVSAVCKWLVGLTEDQWITATAAGVVSVVGRVEEVHIATRDIISEIYVKIKRIYTNSNS